MSKATITSKGQITIPIQVRAALGLGAGDRVEFVETVKGQFAIVAASIPVQRLKGLVRKPANAVSIEEMRQAIAKRGSQTEPKK